MLNLNYSQSIYLRYLLDLVRTDETVKARVMELAGSVGMEHFAAIERLIEEKEKEITG